MSTNYIVVPAAGGVINALLLHGSMPLCTVWITIAWFPPTLTGLGYPVGTKSEIVPLLLTHL